MTLHVGVCIDVCMRICMLCTCVQESCCQIRELIDASVLKVKGDCAV